MPISNAVNPALNKERKQYEKHSGNPLGLFVALAVLAAVIILECVGGIERFQRGNHVNALFNNVQDLKVGDRVKMAGVEIGRVENIQLTNNQGAGRHESDAPTPR